jgi:hypothetical protein
MCCFCVFVKFALGVIAISGLACSLCGRGSHGFGVVMVPLHSDRSSHIYISHVLFSRCNPATL